MSGTIRHADGFLDPIECIYKERRGIDDTTAGIENGIEECINLTLK